MSQASIWEFCSAQEDKCGSGAIHPQVWALSKATVLGTSSGMPKSLTPSPSESFRDARVGSRECWEFSAAEVQGVNGCVTNVDSPKITTPSKGIN
jgi:hypothetical protein